MSDGPRPDLASHITQITDPLIQLSKAKGDTNALLVATLLGGVLHDAGPRQTEVLRRSAIPHWIDVGVLRVLREQDDGNERVLEKLRAYSFVRSVGPDRYAYHDQVRRALLNEWRATQPEQLREIHRKLYTYFDGLGRTADHATTQSAADDSEQPRAIVAMGTWDLWRREALYHLLCADSAIGMVALGEWFDLLLSAHRLAEAEALLQMTDEVELDEQARLLVRYLSARLAGGGLRLASASEQLKVLLDDPHIDGELRAQVQQTLAEVYAETGQWVHATDLYRSSLTYWQAQQQAADPAMQQRAARAAANVMLLLGDAYVGLAANTGGWYITATPPSTVPHWFVGLWEWLLGLPFVIIAWFLRRTKWRLPRPQYCAQYQNWLLIRLYRTAQEWFSTASDAFQALDDQDGLLRSNQQLARILLVYGYTDEAIRRLKQLLDWPAAQNLYQRCWIERFLAEALLETGDTERASALLTDGLKVFRAAGDVRREAAVLALQGRVAAYRGETNDALASYRDSLDRFRSLNYAPARETILHDLRAWNRRSIHIPILRQQIAQLIAAEPDKRYMARFPRTLLPLLQGASLLALPLALILLAAAAPTTAVHALAGDQPLSINVVFDPARALGVAVVLLPLYLASYAIMAMTVISLLPIGSINREQPDYIVTSPEGVALYNRTGALEQYMSWSTVRRKFALDRRIWTRPLPLYSRTFLEDQLGNDLRIDGITGWYVSLILDIDHHLAQTGHQIEEQDLGYALLRSKSGAACVLAIVCILIYAGAENGYSWLPLLRILPPFAYTLFGMITLSGVLFLVPFGYWIARRPLKLQRELNLVSNWPWIVIIVGATPILAFVLSTLTQLAAVSINSETINSLITLISKTTLIPILTYSTVLWGIYMIAEGIGSLLLVKYPTARRILVIGAVICGFIAMLPLVVTLFFNQWSSVAIHRAALLSDAKAPLKEIDAAATMAYWISSRANDLNNDPTNVINQGSSQFYAQRFDEAEALYTRAIGLAQLDSAEQALAFFNRSQVQLKRDDTASAQQDLQEAKRICSQPAVTNDPICRSISRLPNSSIRPLPATNAAPPESTPAPAP